VRLSELRPRWLNDTVFIFLCPHCQKRWLSCKSAPMSTHEQMDLFIEAMKDEDLDTVVPTRQEFAWSINTRDFETMSVHPSIDASPSGDWHGFIKEGAIA
jgi:hypothetical protein